jgi:DNA-binding NtrC family response regulator
VEAHGGTIHASSTPGAGSTFTISLPVVSVAAPADIASVRVATPAAPRRVLVVDDEPAVLAATERLLRSAGYAVEATTEPWLALSRLRQSPDAWDVLLTDFMMPGMLGTDLAVACRTHAPDLAVVIMTGNQAALGGGIREGSYHVVLPKPFTVDELDTSLRRAVDRLRDTRQSELRSTA